MDHTNIKSIGEIYSDIQEAYTVQGKARIGSTAAKATDSSVSSAVDKALANKGTAVSASSEKGKTGVTGSGSFAMSGGSSNKAKPKPTPTSGGSRPKPTSSTSRPTPQSGSAPTRPVRVQNPASDTRRPGASSLGGGMSIGRGGGGGRGGMVRSDTTSDLDTYNLVLEYLLDEGFASTEESADKIILNMSETWFADIMEKKNLEVEKKGREVAGYEKAGKYQGITSKFRKEHPGSREEKKERGRKPTEGELTQERIKKHNERVAKHGFTEKEKKESKAREKYDSPRD